MPVTKLYPENIVPYRFALYVDNDGPFGVETISEIKTVEGKPCPIVIENKFLSSLPMLFNIFEAGNPEKRFDVRIDKQGKNYKESLLCFELKKCKVVEYSIEKQSAYSDKKMMQETITILPESIDVFVPKK